MGSSPSSCQKLFPFFFFFHSFFFSFQLLENHQRKIFFFSFSSKPNKFIKIYFIHFFSSFTHCKTLENVFFLHIIFFFKIKFWSICPKFLKQLVLTLNPSVQHFSYSIHQAYNFNSYTTHDHTSLMLYTLITYTTHNPITHLISVSKMHKDA